MYKYLPFILCEKTYYNIKTTLCTKLNVFYTFIVLKPKQMIKIHLENIYLHEFDLSFLPTKVMLT